MIDLVYMRALTWRGDVQIGADYAVEEIPADLQEQAEEYHAKLVERVAETDEALLEKYLGGEEITPEEIKAAVRKLTINSELYPIFCGSAFKNKGVQPMLDAVIDYLPSPLDVKPMVGHKVGDESVEIIRKPDATRAVLGPRVQGRGAPVLRQADLRPGVLRRASPPARAVVNSTKGKKERIGKLFQMHSNKENPVDEARAGHIYAMIGLKETTTGDTLSDAAQQVVLESMTFPEPVISVAIEPKTKGDQEKLGTAIQRLAEEDPTFQVELDQETGQTIIKGMGELHLDILVDRMKREYKVEANVGKPQVAYRETIRRAVAQGGLRPQEADRWFGPVRQGPGHDRAHGHR